MTTFKGVFTALVTPFDEGGSSIDFPRLAANVERQAEHGVDGVVPCGTTGEAPTLSDREHREVIERTVEAAAGRGLAVIAGAGSNCTSHAVELHRFAAAAGAHAALHVCPYYNKPSQEGLYRHFMTIADSSDLPIVLYNIPGRTGVCLAAETIGRLAVHPCIQALKDATGGLTVAGAVLEQTELAVLSGDDPLTLPLLVLGGAGVISVLSNLEPAPVVALCAAVESGDHASALRIHRDLRPLAEALLTLEPNPVGVKAALRRLGLDSGAVRLPLVPPSESTIARLDALLHGRRLVINPQPV